VVLFSEVLLRIFLFKRRLVTTEDEGPMTMGSPLVLSDFLESLGSTKDARVGSSKQTRRGL